MGLEALQAGVSHVRDAPKDAGKLELIVRRPTEGERELLDEAELDLAAGLVGDSWRTRGTPEPKAQITLTNARAAALGFTTATA
jgi:hypothetical protein